MRKINNFINIYNQNFLKISTINDSTQKKLIQVFKLIEKIKKKKKKIIIAGNGGSAAISSHFSVDMTKIGNVRCTNFNESDLITCFSNDYGYENWVKESLKYYLDSQDLVILISSSGKSMNMINAANFLRKKNNNLITFTGFKGKNKLSKLGNVNFIVNSKSYNYIENAHQYWLLTLVDICAKFLKR
tara:strand:- start:570 stop:1130 length:561 start_codon:yes stop_codon:yes gene_type:complete